MEWVKLGTGYYRDSKVLRAGEAAEVLFTRALAYCGEQETAGHIPREALVLICASKPMPRVRALVREGLLLVVDDGWRIANWDRWQHSAEQVRARRDAGRRRAAAYRSRNGVSNAVTNGVSNAHDHAAVTGAEGEVEVEAAAAAAAELPTSIEILRGKLQAFTALRALRFDGLTPDRVSDLLRLLDVHGDAVLVDTAVRTCRTPPPVHVSAFIGTWSALPEPGQRLKLLDEPLCEVHEAQREPAARCRYCAADRLAGDA